MGTMVPMDDVHWESVLRISDLIDAAIRRRRENEFDQQRRTMEWAEREASEREARLQELIADGPLGTICIGSHARTSEAADAGWGQCSASAGDMRPTGCHVAALAADLAPRILP